eukprot:c1514_g1_i2.p2 GENE.c1514_g1_i2~~c1514_g1_i2.p2  ORF type:complete len:259 (-),score=72.58 c1514_g1_i2:244-1020(-)
MIVKTNDDLRQEQLAFQLIAHLHRSFTNANLPLFLYPYRILVTGPEAGCVEVVPNAVSLDQVKHAMQGKSLLSFFTAAFGPEDGLLFKQAQRNFVESLAAYSVVCYLLNIKDRHNGNILLTRDGHVVHIDFGFMLGNAPRGAMETAPFKLTRDYVEVIGGYQSRMFRYFHHLCLGAMVEAKRSAQTLVLLVDGMQGSRLPCFGTMPSAVVAALRDRLCIHMTREQLESHVSGLIEKSAEAWTTRQYDNFQHISNNIHK